MRAFANGLLAASVMIAGTALTAEASVISAAQPSTYGTLVASYDPLANGYNWPANSGHRWEIVPGLIGDQTTLVSDVFRVNQNIVVGSGPNTLNLVPGDMVFAYTISLVTTVPNQTVTNLDQFKVSGIPLFSNGMDILWHENVKGLGWVQTASINPSTTQLSTAGALGGFADYNWPLGAGLDNDQTITVLMYTGPSALGWGTGNFTVPAGQPGGLNEIVQGNAAAPKVYIPKIPTPGALALLAIGGVAAIRRRR